MSINTSIYTQLDNTSITSIVSTRIFPNDAAEGTALPLIIYTQIKSEPQITLSGSCNLTKYTVQIDSFSRSVSESQTLATAINTQLHGYTGGSIQGSFLIDSQQEEIGDANEGDIYHRIQTYIVWFTEY